MPRPWWASATTKATSASSVPGRALVAADRDDLAAELGDERDPVVVVDVGEPVQVASRDARIGGEVAQVAGARRQAGVERRRARRRRPGRIGRRCTVPPSATTTSASQCGRRLGTTGATVQSRGIVRIEAEQREDARCGWRRSRGPASDSPPGTHGCDLRWCGPRPSRAAVRRARRARAGASVHRGGIGRARVDRAARVASASRCVQVRGTQRTRPYPPPPKASHLPPATSCASACSSAIAAALAVDGQLQVGQRILVVGVAAALGDQHVGRERAHRAGHHRAERAQPAGVVGARRQRDVDRRCPRPRRVPISVGSPVPGNSVRGSWCRLIGQHPRVVVERGLHAVAVVHVDVDVGDLARRRRRAACGCASTTSLKTQNPEA